MRVALCIIGQPRHFEETFPSIFKNIIKPNNADVFFHCWYDPEEAGEEIKNGGLCYYKNRKKGFIMPKGLDKNLVELYKPKKYIIEKQRFLKIESDKMKGVDCTTGLSMYYSIMKSHDLVREYENENNFRYDFIIKIRYDMYCEEPLIMKKYNPKVMNNPHFPNKQHLTNHIDDRIWFSSSENMYKVSRGYLEVENYVEDKDRDKYIYGKAHTFTYQDKTYFNNETYFLYLIQTKKIKLHKMLYKYQLFGRMK